MQNPPMSRRFAKSLVIVVGLGAALMLQGCVVAAAGAVVGTTVGVAAKVGGAAVGAAGHVVTGGKHKKKKHKDQ